MHLIDTILLIVGVIFCSITSVCVSNELLLKSSFPHHQEANSTVNHTLQMISMDKATDAALHIGEFLRNYTIELPNIANSTGSTSSKKAPSTIYIQQVNNNKVNGDFGNPAIHNLSDIVPFLVDNFLSPIIQRVFIDRNAYTVFGGGNQSTEAPVTEQQSTAPPNNDLIIQVDEGTESLATTAATTTAFPETTTDTSGSSTTTTTQNGNSGRDLLEESGNEVSSSSASNKSKYRIRLRERPSTRKPYIADEDDEDESLVLNKIKHL